MRTYDKTMATDTLIRILTELESKMIRDERDQRRVKQLKSELRRRGFMKLPTMQ